MDGIRRSSRISKSSSSRSYVERDDDDEDFEPVKPAVLRSSRRLANSYVEDEEYSPKSRKLKYEEDDDDLDAEEEDEFANFESRPVGSFEELPEVMQTLTMDELKEFCTAQNIKPPRARTAIVTTIIDHFKDARLFDFLNCWKAPQLDLFIYHWGASTHGSSTSTKAQKAVTIENYLINGYINWGDPNRRGVSLADEERAALVDWMNPPRQIAGTDPVYYKFGVGESASSSLHGGVLSQRLHALDQLWFAYALFLYDTRPEFRKGVLLRLADKEHTQIRKNLTGLFAEMIVHDVFMPFFDEEPSRSQFVSGEDDGGASSFIDLVFKKCRLYIPSNAYRKEDKKCRPGGSLAVEVKTGQFSYIKQQIELGHVLRQAELHRAADLSVIVLSKDFKQTATEAIFREKLREVNTEALALLPTKKILDSICIKIVELVRSSPEEIQRQLALSSSTSSLSASTSSSGSSDPSSPADSPTQGPTRRSARVKASAPEISAHEMLVKSISEQKKPKSAGSAKGAKRTFRRIKEPMVVTRVGDLPADLMMNASVEVVTNQLANTNLGPVGLTDEELAAQMQAEELKEASLHAKERGEMYVPPAILSLNSAMMSMPTTATTALGGSAENDSHSNRSLSMAQSIHIMKPPEESPTDQQQLAEESAVKTTGEASEPSRGEKFVITDQSREEATSQSRETSISELHALTTPPVESPRDNQTTSQPEQPIVVLNQELKVKKAEKPEEEAAVAEAPKADAIGESATAGSDK